MKYSAVPAKGNNAGCRGIFCVVQQEGPSCRSSGRHHLHGPFNEHGYPGSLCVFCDPRRRTCRLRREETRDRHKMPRGPGRALTVYGKARPIHSRFPSCYNKDMSAIRIGCSGFNYRHWKGPFYPPGLPQRKWFSHYCTVFASVELNVTFYRLPQASTFDKWHDETPDGFAFSLKGSRFITHVKRLVDPQQPLELFFERSLRLKNKLKVVLWQFPPAFRSEPGRLQRFLELLRIYPVKNTFEFRHESWITGEIIALCGEFHAGLCRADWPGFLNDLPVTSDFVYMRRHGTEGNYATSYSRPELQKDARRAQKLSREGKDVFIYFNNDAYGYAPRNARELLDMIR